MFHSPAFVDLLAPFQSLFTKPTWEKVLMLVEGTVLARGRRTVTAALRSMGQEHLSSFTCFHQVLNRARWSPLKLSRLLLLLLVSTFVHAGRTVEIVVDETLERRWGPHIHKCAYYHDPVRSSQKYRKISRGLKWLCVMLIVTPRFPEPNMGTAFSLCVTLLRKSGHETGTAAQNGSRVDQPTRESRPPMAPHQTTHLHW